MYMYEGELGLCSGLNTQLSPMWQRFDSQSGHHKWVEFVGSLLCSERCFIGFPLSSKTIISFDLICVYMCELISVFSVHSITCFTVQVFTEISTAPEQAPLLKCWPRISTVVPMKHLFKEFRPKKNLLKVTQHGKFLCIKADVLQFKVIVLHGSFIK